MRYLPKLENILNGILFSATLFVVGGAFIFFALYGLSSGWVVLPGEGAAEVIHQEASPLWFLLAVVFNLLMGLALIGLGIHSALRGKIHYNRKSTQRSGT